MEKDITGSLSKNSDDITVYHHDKEGQMVKVTDLVVALTYHYDKIAKIDLIEKIIADEHFIAAAAALIGGTSDNEWSQWGNDLDGTKYCADKLREALLPFANDGAVQLVSHMRNQVTTLQQAVKDRDDYIKELKAQWPPSFEKYQPQPTRTYCRSDYVSDDQVRKLIEHVSTNGL